jgi:exodeoxyribonuclease-3
MVVTDHGEFLLYNVYFPNGGSGEERHLFKQEFLRKLARHLVKVVKGGREVVVVGDYNVAHADIDVYNPELLAGESGFLREERAWMTAFLADGFVDLFRAFHPEAKNRFTWWNQIEKARPSNKGWRIDYICASVKLAKRFTSCDILDSVQGSDHCPVVAEFK